MFKIFCILGCISRLCAGVVCDRLSCEEQASQRLDMIHLAGDLMFSDMIFHLSVEPLAHIRQLLIDLRLRLQDLKLCQPCRHGDGIAA